MHSIGARCTLVRMRISRVLLALLACTLPAHAARFPKLPKYEVVHYIFGHGGTLDGSTIAAKKMTRINYAFALKGGVIAERSEHDAENLAVLTALRKGNPQLQILISVGGGDVGSAGFSDMAITPEGRRRFVDSAIVAVEKYGLDGVDIDWEYPGYTHVKTTTVRREDRETYTLLLKELRQRFDRDANALPMRQSPLARPLK
jgi:chitinase